MKHTGLVTALLLLFFLVSQFIGLGLLAYNAQIASNTSTGEITVAYSDTALGPRPELSGWGSLAYIVFGVGFGTLLLLLLIKIKRGKYLWKAWYFLAVVFAITIAFGVIVSPIIAFLLAVLLTVLKFRFTNIFTHNISEVFMYAGIAILIVPLFDVFWASILLVLISIYDMYAVWKSKHMVKLAKFTSESKLFAGFMVTYTNKTDNKKSKTKILGTYRKHPNESRSNSVKESKTSSEKKARKTATSPRQAILGGGDITFPLIFSGAVLSTLLLAGYTKLLSFLFASIISITTTFALFLLFYMAKKDRFYPAMPFVSLGCLVGYGLVQLILFLL